jgi:hypothetical protein
MRTESRGVKGIVPRGTIALKYRRIVIQIPPLAANQDMLTTCSAFMDTFSHFSEKSVLPIVLCWRLLINWITPPKRCI